MHGLRGATFAAVGLCLLAPIFGWQFEFGLGGSRGGGASGESKAVPALAGDRQKRRFEDDADARPDVVCAFALENAVQEVILFSSTESIQAAHEYSIYRSLAR